MTIRELREEALKIGNQARALLETITPENRADKDAEFDRMMADADSYAKRADSLEKIENREKSFEAIATDVPSIVTEARSSEETAEQRFDSYLRGDISERELRNVMLSANGGNNLVPTTLSNKLIEVVKYWGPMFDDTIVNVLRTTSGNPINLPKTDDTSNVATLVAEGATLTDTDNVFTQVALGAYKFHSGNVKVSSELLTDSAIDVPSTVTTLLGKRLGRGINAYLTTGTGSSQPQGIVTGASAGKSAASATAIAAAELIDLYHSVDIAYRKNGAFMAKDTTIAALRKLVDSTGQFVWNPGLALGQPETLLSRPIYANNDMAAMTTGNKTVLFGDFKSYTVRLVNDVTIKRLDERYADADLVAFLGLLRVDAKVTDSTGIKYLVQA